MHASTGHHANIIFALCSCFSLLLTAASPSLSWKDSEIGDDSMRRFIAAIGFSVVVASAGFAMAASEYGAAREADMKAIGGAVKTASGFVTGKVPFDAAAARAAMETVAAKATDFPTRFPAGSENADKGASPKIWENKADFEARAAKLASDATAAAAAADQGLDAFKTAFGTVASNCKGCHQNYRLSD